MKPSKDHEFRGFESFDFEATFRPVFLIESEPDPISFSEQKKPETNEELDKADKMTADSKLEKRTLEENEEETEPKTENLFDKDVVEEETPESVAELKNNEDKSDTKDDEENPVSHEGGESFEP